MSDGLEELELAEDTLVIFLSDNGAEGQEGSRFNAGMRGMKGKVHEGGMRGPCFFRWPGKIEAGKVLDEKGDEQAAEETDESRLEQLKAGLEQAISEERYEDAAEIRDSIRELEHHSSHN